MMNLFTEDWFRTEPDTWALKHMKRKDAIRMNWHQVEVAMNFWTEWESICLQVRNKEDITAIQEYIIQRVMSVMPWPTDRSMGILQWGNYAIFFETIEKPKLFMTDDKRFFIDRYNFESILDGIETEAEFHERTLYIH